MIGPFLKTFLCDACRRRRGVKFIGFMVGEKTWNRVAIYPKGYLCQDCMSERLGSPISRRHMLDCQWNRDLMIRKAGYA